MPNLKVFFVMLPKNLKKGKTIMLDYGGRDDPFPEEMLNYLDFISPNEV